MTELPENYERDMLVFEELNRTAFPNIGQAQQIRETTRNLGYDKCRIEVLTEGSLPTARYCFLKGRKIVRSTYYIELPQDVADSILEANRKAGR